MKKLKLKKEIIIIGVAIVLIVLARFIVKENQIKPIEPKYLDEFRIGSKTYKLKRNEELYVNGWNELEILYNNERYNDLPTIAKSVTLTTSYKDVLKVFNIQEGYAIVNMEVSENETDDTTQIIEKVYKNKKVFKKTYLDLYLLFGYKKVNDEWTMITAKELKKLIDTDEELLIYYIDFNGMSDEIVNKGEVISFSITHQ